MTKQAHASPDRSLLLFGFGGVVAGACLAMIIAGLFLLGRLATSRFSPSLPLPVPTTSTPAQPRRSTSTATLASPTPPLLTATTADNAQALFEEAEAYLNSNPQRVLDLLAPLIGHLTEPEDLARAYRDLGQAEADLNHFQLAAVYCEKLYLYQPTLENLYLLATLYDLGGNLPRALEKYRAIAVWPGSEADPYRATVQQRIQDILQVIGTATPPS